MRTATVADNLIAGVALQPISWRGLNDSDEKRTIVKLTIGNFQVALKYCFFTDRAYFRHFCSFPKRKGESHRDSPGEWLNGIGSQRLEGYEGLDLLVTYLSTACCPRTWDTSGSYNATTSFCGWP
jgi:hypothetical protein